MENRQLQSCTTGQTQVCRVVYYGERRVATTLDYVHRADRDARIEARFKPMSYKVTPQINIP